MENTTMQQNTSAQSGKKYSIRMPHEKPFAQAVIIFVVVFCTAFSFIPLFLTVINAFKTTEQVATNAFGLPMFNTMFGAAQANFAKAWGVIGPYFLKTMLLALIGAVLKVIVSAVLAYILTFKNFYFKDLIFMFFIAVLLVPSIIGYPILVPLIKDTFKLGDTAVGYLLPMVGGGQVVGMFLFKTFFGQQPKSLYESAQLDGANDFVMFTRITIPLALPIILYHFVGCFAGIYNEYLWASLILRSNPTLMVIMHSSVASGDIQYGASYAMYLISSLPLIATAIISIKYFKSGEFAAGLKL